jgi:hypothetical protein
MILRRKKATAKKAARRTVGLSMGAITAEMKADAAALLTFDALVGWRPKREVGETRSRRG